MKADEKIHSHLAALQNAATLSAALKIVESLSKLGLTWRPVGGRETNFGQIEIGADGGYALIERVTNAIDAVLEFKALRQKKLVAPTSPRDASNQWFDVPDGRVALLRIPNGQPDLKKRQELASNVIVRLHDGSHRRTPTIEIIDTGTGLSPAQMPTTILSLGESNKIDKRYLAGAYGQGGSTAFAFSKSGTLIASRRQPSLLKKNDAEVIAITFVRYNQLDPDQNKNGRYEYLALIDGTVPSIPTSQAADFMPGTRVVHFDMDIQKYGQTPTFDTLRERILQGLSCDEDLARLEDERRERLLSKHSDRDKEKLKQRFAKLMERFHVGKDAAAGGKGGKEGSTKEQKQSSSRGPLQPLKTRLEPTFIKIANTQKPLRLELGRAAVLRLESDAPDGYLNEHSRAQLAVTADPPNSVDKENHSDFRGGRARVMLKLDEQVKAGQKGSLSVFLFTAKGFLFPSP